ncbi:unnamed protein product [[Actinomadura] parvosata subsp. kistnae]|uniref:Uncharacterized protein n=1 Tax=[Actinomadura] parvosata subsp. kistnae TaxID=1909395 RepID=A0A1U9ZVL8_9ACTN|nr:hypothetical protein [Nonomuraea sp. ATCC 55076]AQZ61969.1 hypothetical protein BKM31_11230 [Nonomuraea sp. ATCC 55076]SPL99873.1 unnamed protein product [Actinomadura parvosata subsp. kistnae]
MGVLVDYFTAESDEAAGRVMSGGPAGAKVPYVDCKGWIDEPGGLVAGLTGRDVGEFPDSVEVADDGEVSGVDRVMPETVAALAAVPDERVREYAEDELLHPYEVERITALRDLAREAVRLGRGMYRWTCV